MPITVSIKEYDKLHIRKNRDLERHIISETDAAYLQTAIIDNSPVFSYGNRCLIAQHWVGVIELPEYTIEILPKLYGEVSEDDLRNVLIRMLLVAHQTSAIRKFQASVSIRKNSLIEPELREKFRRMPGGRRKYFIKKILCEKLLFFPFYR